MGGAGAARIPPIGVGEDLPGPAGQAEDPRDPVGLPRVARQRLETSRAEEDPGVADPGGQLPGPPYYLSLL